MLFKAVMTVLILLVASNLFAAQLTLTWVDNSNAETGFEIWSCNGANCTTFTLLTTVPANTTSFVDTGLAELITKTYEVRAVSSTNPASNSAFSNMASGTTKLNAPSGAAVAN